MVPFPLQKQPRDGASLHSHGNGERGQLVLCLGVPLAWDGDAFESSHAPLGWGCLSFPMFPAVWRERWTGLGKTQVLVPGWPTVGWESVVGAAVNQREGCVVRGVVGGFYPLHRALSIRRHRLIRRECKFHHGNNCGAAGIASLSFLAGFVPAPGRSSPKGFSRAVHAAEHRRVDLPSPRTSCTGFAAPAGPPASSGQHPLPPAGVPLRCDHLWGRSAQSPG